MTLRTTALIAGALGLLLLIGGLIADAMRPAAFGTPSASLETPVLVIDPDMVAMAPGGTITIEGSGTITAYSGRVDDADEWAASRDVTTLTGVPTWEELSTETQTAPAPSTEPSAEPSASASASTSASESSSPSASAEASASPSASASPAAQQEIADIWRDSWSADAGTLELENDALPVGLAIVVESEDGSPLSSVTMRIDRVVNDGWVTPLKWWGAFLAAVGLVALIFVFIDHRGAGSKVETAVASRRQAPPATPGGRRERREALTAGEGIPVVASDDEEDSEQGAPEHEAPEQDSDEASEEPFEPTWEPVGTEAEPDSEPEVRVDGATEDDAPVGDDDEREDRA
ncbi:hypothetical protein [Demequina mangrovi]|uniref:Uncharacterized protein n=1 Tax=Demequina mangrovi TaxID=1043493 RepID=A0A1H6X157_9MICO|nr:hypothetical protein [Demequina mangrovi]SEJ22789.1 hypothetical protein SAMN05421637_1234 [Demequina mangrovi]